MAEAAAGKFNESSLSNHEQYRRTTTGGFWEFARIPGECAAVAGFFMALGGDPLGVLLLAGGVAEIAGILHFDTKAEDRFLAAKQAPAGVTAPPWVPEI